jgi:hypothetical protein
MYEYKKNISRFAPVRMFTAAGTPVSGVSYSDVTATAMKANGSILNFSVGSADWIEATTGAFAGAGVYAVRLPASVLDIPGMLVYAIKAPGAESYIGSVKVVDYEEIDTFNVATLLTKYQEGRWKIHTSGADAYRLVLYDTDGVTVLKKFDLKDSSGAPSVQPIFERVPV